ncbi:MAG: HD domain-containing protein [Lentisphaeria bacterium]
MIDEEALQILYSFYPKDTPLRRLLLKHSGQVRTKALAILKNPECAKLQVDAQLVSSGAILHDIGIGKCHAPSILCVGTEPYLAHGIIGAKMLREYAQAHSMDLAPYARICERHTGVGITAEEIRMRGLPLPERDYLPESPEEKLICLADTFFSKSGDMKEKSVNKIRCSMEKFGEDTVVQFDKMCNLFGI